MDRRVLKIILGIIIALIVIASAIAVYFYFKDNTPTLTVDDGGQSTDTGTSRFGFTVDQNSVARDQNGNLIETSGGPEPEMINGLVLPPKLRHIYESPIAGADFGNISYSYSTTSAGKKVTVTKNIPNIRFIDRALGYIYETATSTIINTRIANLTAPKTYEALFGADAKSVLLQSLIGEGDSIASYFGNLIRKPQPVLVTTSSSTAGTIVSTSTAAEITDSSVYVPARDGYEIKGDFIPNGVKIIEISPDRTRAFYIDSSTGEANGVILNLSNGQRTIVWRNPLIQWNASWAGNNEILLWNAPSALSQGALYIFNLTTKQTTLLVSPVAGLTAKASPQYAQNKLVLVGSSADGTPSLSLLDTSKKSSRLLPFKTLPEKCVWSQKSTRIYCAVPSSIPDAAYPDSWYQGQISFDDNLWSVDTKTGASFELYAFTNANTKASTIDATNLVLNPTEDYLLFRNKKDLSLWGYRLIDPIVPTPPVAATSTKAAPASSGSAIDDK